MARILIVDDDEKVCSAIKKVIKKMGHETESASTLKQAMKSIEAAPYDIVFLDVRLPDGDGLKKIEAIQKNSSSPEVIIITGFGDPDGAELAIKKGAWDYIEKPSSSHTIQLVLNQALQYRKEKQTSPSSPAVLDRKDIIGNSPHIKSCIGLVAQAARSDINVLIRGETGTGKELFALAIHNNSRRSHKNFVVVDCAALPKTLVESVLFGHEKGAFTSADKAREGLVKQADGGTLFLDEVGELPLSVQKAFLRVLQEHRFRPVGGKREIRSDFRLIAATNRDIEKMVKEGKFREDLFFRIGSLIINLSPLREYPEDIEEIVNHYIPEICKRFGIATKGFSPDFLETLIEYDWPGNVRELINALEKAISSAHNEPTLFARHLPTSIRVKVARDSIEDEMVAPKSMSAVNDTFPEKFPSLQDYRENAEREYLEKLIAKTRGNIKKSCSISGLSRSRLYALMKKYQITSRK